jgi:hypothetical protein
MGNNCHDDDMMRHFQIKDQSQGNAVGSFGWKLIGLSRADDTPTPTKLIADC